MKFPHSSAATLLLPVICLAFSNPVHLASAQEKSDPAAAVTKEYNAVEASIQRARMLSVSYPQGNLSGYYSIDGRLLKLSSFETSSNESSEITLDSKGEPIFIFVESSAKDGAGPVTQARIYIAGGKAVKYTETKKKDVSDEKAKPVVKPAEQAWTDTLTFAEWQEKVTEFRTVLEAVNKPAKVEIIEGTTSPDGKYAVGWSKDPAIDADSPADEISRHTFLVRVKPLEVLARLDGTEIEADSRNGGNAVWSENSRWMLESSWSRWGKDVASLWHIGDDGTVSGPLNVLHAIDDAVLKAMKAAKNPDAGSPWVVNFENPVIGDDGAMKLKVNGTVPKEGPGYDASFSLTPQSNGEGGLIVGEASARLFTEEQAQAEDAGGAWDFAMEEDADGIPRGKVSLTLKGEAHVILKEATGNFAELDEEAVARYKIPAGAMACSGHWAGLTEILYAVQDGEQHKVYQRSDDAEGGAGKFKLIKTIK